MNFKPTLRKSTPYSCATEKQTSLFFQCKTDGIKSFVGNALLGMMMLLLTGMANFAYASTTLASAETTADFCTVKTITIKNSGTCAVNLYLWKASGDVFQKKLDAGKSWSGRTTRGTKWRVVDTRNDWRNLQYDKSYTVTADCNQTWTVRPSYCAPACNAKATGIWLVKHDGRKEVSLSANQTICSKDIGFTDGFIRVKTSGTLQSAKIWISGAVSNDKLENAAPYDSKVFRIKDGTYKVRVQLFTKDNAQGTNCGETVFNFTVKDCTVCKPKVTFKNTGCRTLSLHSTEGFTGTMAPGKVWSTNSAQGTKWTFKVGNSTIKTWTVTSCNATTENIDSKGDADGDGVCDDKDCKPNDKNFPATVGKACNDGNPNTENDKVQAGGCSCAGTPIPTTCDGKIRDIWLVQDGGTKEIKLTNNQTLCLKDIDFNKAVFRARTSGTAQSVKLWIRGAITQDVVDNHPQYDSKSFTVKAGTYKITASVFSKDGAKGIKCSEVVFNYTIKDCTPKCPDGSALKTPGTPCNDGNANTENDVIQADGCSCAGTAIPKCPDGSALKTPGTACNDGNAGTENDKIQADGCSCAGTVCTTKRITIKNNGACAVNLYLWDPNGDIFQKKLEPGKSWSGNTKKGVKWRVVDLKNDWRNLIYDKSYTVNDHCIQTWSVTPNYCTNNPCYATGDDDGDGVCNDKDCKPNDKNFPATPNTACNDGNANTENDKVQADGCSCAGTPIPTTCDGKIRDIWLVQDGGTKEIKLTNNQTLCLKDIDFNKAVFRARTSGTVQSVKLWIRGAITQDVVDNHPQYDSKSFTVKAGTYKITASVFSKDGAKGIKCSEVVFNYTIKDCTPKCPDGSDLKTPGDACDDKNANTENDVIQADGCSCAGTVPVCTTKKITIKNNGPCTVNLYLWDPNGDIFQKKLKQGQSWSGNTTKGVKWRVVDLKNDWANLIYDKSYTVNDDCNQTWTVTPNYCTNNPCYGAGDTDGDGVCDDKDCKPNDKNFPAAVGSACDDGNAATINDKVQAGGCSCKGEPKPTTGGDCANISITSSKGQIIITGLDGAPVTGVQIFDKNNNWAKVFQCAGNCKATEAITLPYGNYHVIAKYYTHYWKQICQVRKDITVTGNGGGTTGDNGGTTGDDGGGTTGDDGGTTGDGGGTNGDDGGTTGDDGGGSVTDNCGTVKVAHGNGKIIITGVAGKKYFCKIDRIHPGYQAIENCVNAACASTNMTFSNLKGGKYSIRMYHTDWSPVCDEMKIDMKGTDLTTGNGSVSNRIATNATSTLAANNATRIKAVTNATNTSSTTELATKYNTNTTLPQLKAYPNPANTELFISTNGIAGQKGQITLFNQFGQIMRQVDLSTLSKETLRIDVSTYTAGLYLISTQLESGELLSEKILINK